MSDSPDPVPDAKPLRMTFAILAVAATLFALGWALLREHPIPAVILIVGSVLYLLYELFTSEVLVRNVPGIPLPFTGEFEVVIMIEIAIEEMVGSD